MTRVLVITQAVDVQDPVLGFFHGWLAELAGRVEHLTVVCLREGIHTLPQNVTVHSLGKEKGRRTFKRLRYTCRFFSLIWKYRNVYDSVFVHMNEEYVLLGGLLWRAWGKRIVLWRNHRMGSWKTRMAVTLADRVCHTSRDAYVARAKNAVRMPIGIDTNRFAPATSEDNSILFLGRLDPIKKVDVFVDALVALDTKSVPFHATLCGEPTDPHSSYASGVLTKAGILVKKGKVKLQGAVRHDETPALYRAHALYVNLTPSGSFDKTIGEAMASGCVVVTANTAVREVVPSVLITDGTVEDTARALGAALALTPEERESIAKRQRAYIEEEHSLALLMPRLTAILQS